MNALGDRPRRASEPAVTVIEPWAAFRWLDFREVWAYRELLGVLVSRDVRVRYRNAFLGAGWALLRPALGVLIFTVLFGRLARLPSEGAPYSVFVLLGLLPWTFFSSAVAAGSDSLVGSQGLVSKVYFPRLLIPLSSLGAPLVDLLVSLPLALAVAAFNGYPPAASWGLILFSLALSILAAAAVAIGVAALNVSYRDIRHLVPFLLQLGLYATPVVFSATLVPERWRGWLYLNPVAGAVELFRAAALGRPPDLPAVLTSAGSGVALLLVSLVYFSRVERRFADLI